MLSIVCLAIVLVGNAVWTSRCVGDAARLPSLSAGARRAWILALLLAPWVAGAVAAMSLGAGAGGWVWLGTFLAVPWLFVLAARHRREGWQLGPALLSSWRATARRSARAWIGHGALVLVLVVALWWLVPMLEKALKDVGGALPGPTQLLVDLSHDLRRGPLLALAWVALAYVLHRWFATLAQLGREPGRAARAFPILVNAALALCVLLVGLAALLSVTMGGTIR